MNNYFPVQIYLIVKQMRRINLIGSLNIPVIGKDQMKVVYTRHQTTIFTVRLHLRELWHVTFHITKSAALRRVTPMIIYYI